MIDNPEVRAALAVMFPRLVIVAEPGAARLDGATLYLDPDAPTEDQLHVIAEAATALRR